MSEDDPKGERGKAIREGIGALCMIVYLIGSFVTGVYLTFFDGYPYTWWNWLIVVPLNFFLGSIWPIYWLILRRLFRT